MFNPVLPPDCYTDVSWFESERKEIFSKLWIFVGLTQQLQTDNDFITRTIGGIPVLVQNLDGKLQAFRNACAHKRMPIQTQAQGNRKMLCPYHGWSYHADGKVKGIPNEHLYNICDKSTLSLQKFAISTIGNFVFVNVSEEPLPIEAQLPQDLRTCLEIVSAHFDTHVSYTTFTGKYNWKLNFENILDWNHVPFVHPKTFSPFVNCVTSLKKDIASDSSIPLQQAQESHQSPFNKIVFNKPINNAENVAVIDLNWIGRIPLDYPRRWYSDLFSEAFDRDYLFSVHAFPNLNFGSLHGESFYLQQYEPLAPDLTNFHSWIFTSKRKKNIPFQPHLLWGMHHAEKRVIDEDKVLLESLQLALSHATGMGIMGDYEHRQHAMARWYMQNLTGT